MKKLFISCPMRKRSEEDIRKTFDKLHRIAEAVFDKELEVIPTYFEENPPANVNEGLWYLGESIVGTFLIVGLTEDDFGELLPEFVEKYEKMFHQPRKFVTYTDSEGKVHLDVDYCTPEE